MFLKLFQRGKQEVEQPRTIELISQNVPLFSGDYAVNPNFVALAMQGCISLFHRGEHANYWHMITYARRNGACFQSGSVGLAPQWRNYSSYFEGYERLKEQFGVDLSESELVRRILLSKIPEPNASEQSLLREELDKYLDKKLGLITRETELKANLIHGGLFNDRSPVYSYVYGMIERHSDAEKTNQG